MKDLQTRTLPLVWTQLARQLVLPQDGCQTCRDFAVVTGPSMESNVQQIQAGSFMPEKKTLERARKDARGGKAPSTQAGEFVREEMEHVRKGKHGARSSKQAIAIGLSKARRAGVKLAPPKKGRASE